MTDTRAVLAAIPSKFATPPAHMVSKLPKAGIMLDYVGHADITLMLIEADPEWTWQPAAIDPATGGPVIHAEGNRLVMWGTLTVGGVTRMAVGTCEARKGEPEKELVGDLLRNGAMRFGIATTLWSKADHVEQRGSAPAAAPKARKTVREVAAEAEQPAAPAAPAPATKEQLATIKGILDQLGLTREQMIEYAQAATGRDDIVKASDITQAEAARMIDTLKNTGDTQ